MHSLPAHSLTLHDTVCTASPSKEQSYPPKAGTGAVHVLVLDLEPTPHSFEQDPYSLQALYPPLTEMKVIKIERN